MGFQRIEYTNSGYPGSPDRLVITSDGAATFESHSNEATPENLEIGFYAAGSRRIDSIRSDRYSRRRPSRRFRTIGVTCVPARMHSASAW
ncbi:MAG: hypothetical protein U0527_16370 [Candidatus Eisenbacteria bacterium]